MFALMKVSFVHYPLRTSFAPAGILRSVLTVFVLLWCIAIPDKMGGRLPGLSWASLKKNPMLIPLFFCIGMGAMGSSLYLLRLAFRSPEVTWYPKKNPEPWNEYRDKQYKFMKIQDNLPTKSPAPEY